MAACTWCNQEMTTGRSCTVECFHERGFDDEGLDDEPSGLGGGCARWEEPEGAPTIFAPKRIGRAFITQVEMPEEPVWSPLEAVARIARSGPDLPSLHEGEFMFMATVRDAREQLAIQL